MMLDEKRFNGLLSAIEEILRGDGEPPVMIGGVVVLAEVTHDDGEVWLVNLRSSDLPIWTEQGMLSSRLFDIAADNAKSKEG